MKKCFARTLLAGAIMSVLACSAGAISLPKDVSYPSDDTGLIYKVYQIENLDELDRLDHGSISFRGKTYNYLDVTVEEERVKDEKSVIKTVSGESDTKDTAKILAELEAAIQEETEDGYSGELTLDASSLSVSATSYGKGSKVKSETKTYPGIAEGDLNAVPKTITANGTTLQLTDCYWKEDSQYNPYDPDIGNLFTAYATYSGSVSYSYAKGYAYEVKYYGTVEKDEVEGYTCTLLFAPEATQNHWYDVYLNKDGSTNGFMVFFTFLFIVMLAALVFLLWPMISGRKEQQVITVEEVVEDAPQKKT